MTQFRAGYFRVYDGSNEVFAASSLAKLTHFILKNRTKYNRFKHDYVRYILYTDSGYVVYNSRVQVSIFEDRVTYLLRNCGTLYVFRYESKKKE